MESAECAPAVVALDVGGSSIKSGLVAPGGRVVEEAAVTAFDSTGPAEEVLNALARVVRRQLRRAGAAQLRGVAVGFPGPFEYETGVCLIQGLTKFGAIYGANLREALRVKVELGDLPVVFRNDAEAAIIGEALYGAGRPFSRLVGVTLGTGCGSAFIADGVPVTAGDGVPPHGWIYPIPFRGARVDDWFSTRGVQRRLREAGITLTDVAAAADAAAAGDALCRRVWEGFGADLGEVLAPLAVQFRAEAILVLGRIARALDLFRPALQHRLPVPALPPERGAAAALLGAAELLLGHNP